MSYHAAVTLPSDPTCPSKPRAFLQPLTALIWDLALVNHFSAGLETSIASVSLGYPWPSLEPLSPAVRKAVLRSMGGRCSAAQLVPGL